MWISACFGKLLFICIRLEGAWEGILAPVDNLSTGHPQVDSMGMNSTSLWIKN